MSELTAPAYHLAWHTDEGFAPSPYGYADESAATVAAPILNRTRLARGYQHYTHVVELRGRAPVDVRPLESLV